MGEPLSIAASVVALAQLCKSLYTFFSDTGTGRALRNDIKELGNQLEELGIQYEKAITENIEIPERISTCVKDIRVQCKSELEALRETLEPMRPTVAHIRRWLKKPDAAYCRDRISTYKQSIQFYVLLITAYFPDN
jgi:hypothetical protein